MSIYASYRSTALLGALVGVNPTFPKQPLSFPGQYGSALVRFEQRRDGNLDFTFDGSTFVPLGKDIVWPLNFVGPSGEFATVPANGTVMHPHLHLSTRAVSPENHSAALSDLPFNTIQEFTLYTHNSSFGDAFTLSVPALGGPAKGAPNSSGGLQIQFGETEPATRYPSPSGLSRLAASWESFRTPPSHKSFPDDCPPAPGVQ